MDNFQTLKIKLLRPEATIPSYAHPGEDAAFDIFSCEDYELMPGQVYTFMSGFASELSPYYWIKIEGKSGPAHHHGIDIIGGVIDAGYRDEWGIIAVNHSARPWVVVKGMAIAQAVIHNRPMFFIEQVKELGDSSRGTHGLGSGHQTQLAIT